MNDLTTKRTACRARLARVGQGLVEYALIMLLIAIAVFVAISLLGVQLQETYQRIAASVNP